MTPFGNPAFLDHLTSAVRYVLPESALVATACLLFVLAAFRVGRLAATAIALAGTVAAALVMAFVPEPPVIEAAYSVMNPTPLAAFVRGLTLTALALYILIGWGETKEYPGEFLACLLVAGAGLSLVGRANDLISLFLALEMISIPTYVMLYLPSGRKLGQEATLKYFMLSVLSSGVLLFGFSYLFGLADSTNLVVIADTLVKAAKVGSVSPLAAIAAIMVIAGLGFRIAAVPFHFYAPDVYEGGPTSVVAQLAYIPKVAGFIALVRVFGLVGPVGGEVPFDSVRTLVPLTLWVIAAITMTLGNILALVQDNLKRMFAYSGIAHAGYMLLGVLAACAVADAKGNATQAGVDGLLVYLAAYGLMTIGAFAVLAYLGHGGDSVETVDDLAGLGRTNPAAAALLGLFLLSMIGLPLTAGFTGKFLVFVGAFDQPADSPMRTMSRILVAVAALNAAIGAVYYLRAASVMFLRTPLKPLSAARGYPAFAAALVCALGTVALGVYPKPLVESSKAAAPLNVPLDSRTITGKE
jgi:NADH-quinone oxidoreductase subunit N